MTTAFLGQIEVYAFNFPPKGWAQCNGQLLAINTNQALFSLLGTIYGGDGIRTFALPDLRGRMPVGVGQGFTQGQAAGEEMHTLLLNEMPQHNHRLMGDSATATASNGDTPGAGRVLGNTSPDTTTGSLNLYSSANTNAILANQVVGFNSGGYPHENRMPFLVFNFCICLSGIFPTRN
jgi:microcystin-dependent protein